MKKIIIGRKSRNIHLEASIMVNDMIMNPEKVQHITDEALANEVIKILKTMIWGEKEE